MKTNPSQIAVERRGQQRWNLAAPISVSSTGDGRLLGHAVNISLRGMLVVGERPIPLRQRLQVDLELPGDDGRWEKTPFIAIGVRAFQDPNDENIFNTGFQLDYLSPHAVFRLQRLIHELESFG